MRRARAPRVLVDGGCVAAAGVDVGSMRCERAIVAALALAGCGREAAVGTSAEPIVGGQPASNLTSVVAVVDQLSTNTVALCSGSLLAPNAVLTARHCVSDLLNAANDLVDCSSAGFGAPRPVANFSVSTDAALPGTAAHFHRVREILVLPDTDGAVCGADLAMLILADNIDAGVATPLVPQLTAAPVAGETYSAVGYGTTGASPQTAGTRRRLDGVRVACVGTACGSTQVAAGEMSGGSGVCPGDSGGPALDSSAEVIGVAARDAQDCTASIYETIISRADWLGSSVRHAAQLGGYTAPEWAAAPLTLSSSGCGVAARPRAGSALGLLGAAAISLALRRRRR